jgi:hypothetical protein
MRIVLAFLVALMLLGCRAEDTGTVMYPRGYDNFGVAINKDRPYYVINDYVIPLVRDERIYGYWITNDSLFSSININEDNTIVFSDVYTIQWAWIYPDVLFIYNEDFTIVEVMKFEFTSATSVNFVLTDVDKAIHLKGFKESF